MEKLLAVQLQQQRKLFDQCVDPLIAQLGNPVLSLQKREVIIRSFLDCIKTFFPIVLSGTQISGLIRLTVVFLSWESKPDSSSSSSNSNNINSGRTAAAAVDGRVPVSFPLSDEFTITSLAILNVLLRGLCGNAIAVPTIAETTDTFSQLVREQEDELEAAAVVEAGVVAETSLPPEVFGHLLRLLIQQVEQSNTRLIRLYAAQNLLLCCNLPASILPVETLSAFLPGLLGSVHYICTLQGASIPQQLIVTGWMLLDTLLRNLLSDKSLSASLNATTTAATTTAATVSVASDRNQNAVLDWREQLDAILHSSHSSNPTPEQQQQQRNPTGAQSVELAHHTPFSVSRDAQWLEIVGPRVATILTKLLAIDSFPSTHCFHLVSTICQFLLSDCQRSLPATTVRFASLWFLCQAIPSNPEYLFSQLFRWIGVDDVVLLAADHLPPLRKALHPTGTNCVNEDARVKALRQCMGLTALLLQCFTQAAQLEYKFLPILTQLLTVLSGSLELQSLEYSVLPTSTSTSISSSSSSSSTLYYSNTVLREEYCLWLRTPIATLLHQWIDDVLLPRFPTLIPTLLELVVTVPTRNPRFQLGALKLIQFLVAAGSPSPSPAQQHATAETTTFHLPLSTTTVSSLLTVLSLDADAGLYTDPTSSSSSSTGSRDIVPAPPAVLDRANMVTALTLQSQAALCLLYPSRFLPRYLYHWCSLLASPIKCISVSAYTCLELCVRVLHCNSVGNFLHQNTDYIVGPLISILRSPYATTMAHAPSVLASLIQFMNYDSLPLIFECISTFHASVRAASTSITRSRNNIILSLKCDSACAQRLLQLLMETEETVFGTISPELYKFALDILFELASFAGSHASEADRTESLHTLVAVVQAWNRIVALRQVAQKQQEQEQQHEEEEEEESQSGDADADDDKGACVSQQVLGKEVGPLIATTLWPSLIQQFHYLIDILLEKNKSHSEEVTDDRRYLLVSMNRCTETLLLLLQLDADLVGTRRISRELWPLISQFTQLLLATLQMENQTSWKLVHLMLQLCIELLQPPWHLLNPLLYDCLKLFAPLCMRWTELSQRTQLLLLNLFEASTQANPDVVWVCLHTWISSNLSLDDRLLSLYHEVNGTHEVHWV